jgi:hypothetical protein
VYSGKGRFAQDDPTKYAGRDNQFTGGWPGGERALLKLRDEENAGKRGGGMAFTGIAPVPVPRAGGGGGNGTGAVGTRGAAAGAYARSHFGSS